jgi:hypothetical protein
MLLLVLLNDGEILAPQHRLPPPREQAAQHTGSRVSNPNSLFDTESGVRLFTGSGYRPRFLRLKIENELLDIV